MDDDGLFLFATIKESQPCIKENYEGERKRIGYVTGVIGSEPCYEATFPIDWYILTLETLGLDLMINEKVKMRFG